jgi:hypothetical protein
MYPTHKELGQLHWGHRTIQQDKWCSYCSDPEKNTLLGRTQGETGERGTGSQVDKPNNYSHQLLSKIQVDTERAVEKMKDSENRVGIEYIVWHQEDCRFPMNMRLEQRLD